MDGLEEQTRKVNDGTIHVPPHLVTSKIGNKQIVMLPNRASFGPMTMARIVAKAGLFKGEESQDAGTRVDEDDFYLMRLQHDKVSCKRLCSRVQKRCNWALFGLVRLMHI